MKLLQHTHNESNALKNSTQFVSIQPHTKISDGYSRDAVSSRDSMFTVLVLILISILMTTVSVLTLLSWGPIFKKILRYS